MCNKLAVKAIAKVLQLTMDSGTLYHALLVDNLPQAAVKRLLQTAQEKNMAAVLSLILGVGLLSLATITVQEGNDIWGISIALLGVVSCLVSFKCFKMAKQDISPNAALIENTIDRLKLEKLQKATEISAILTGEYACHVFKKETHIFGTKILFNGQPFPTGTICVIAPEEFALIKQYIPRNIIKFQKLAEQQ